MEIPAIYGKAKTARNDGLIPRVNKRSDNNDTLVQPLIDNVICVAEDKSGSTETKVAEKPKLSILSPNN
jgi:hypothetical protein